MKKTVAAIAVCGLFVSPALAADANVEAAIKTFESVANDPGKLKIYCEMNKAMDAAEEDMDDNKATALDKKMNEYIKQLGADVEGAFEAGADLDPDAEDGKAYDAALDKLDSKCGP